MVSLRPSLDDTVDGAKNALKILAPLLNIVPFPGLSAAAQILGNIIECVEVCPSLVMSRVGVRVS